MNRLDIGRSHALRYVATATENERNHRYDEAESAYQAGLQW